MHLRLLAAGLVASALLGSVPEAPAADRSEILATIAGLGGTVTFDETLAERPIVRVDLSKTAIQNDDLAFLADLPELRELDVRQTAIGDAAMRHIAPLRQLRFLNVFRTKMTDKGLKQLAGLQELETLLMGGTRVTDDGMGQLVSYPKLRKVSVFDTTVSDAGIKQLVGAKNLEVLLVGKSRVTTQGMKDLQAVHPKLRFTESTENGVNEGFRRAFVDGGTISRS